MATSDIKALRPEALRPEALKRQSPVLEFLSRAKHGRYSDYLEELGALDPSMRPYC